MKAGSFSIRQKMTEFWMINFSRRNSSAGRRPVWCCVQTGALLCQTISSGTHKGTCYYICDFIGPSKKHHYYVI